MEQDQERVVCVWVERGDWVDPEGVASLGVGQGELDWIGPREDALVRLVVGHAILLGPPNPCLGNIRESVRLSRERSCKKGILC